MEGDAHRTSDAHGSIAAVSTPPTGLVRAWLNAAQDLNITVTAPYPVGQQVFVAHVEGFGRDNGTVVDWIASGNDTAELTAEGYHWSAVNLEAYAVYDRDLFRDTLNDWGWHGDPERHPSWYTGRPSTG